MCVYDSQDTRRVQSSSCLWPLMSNCLCDGWLATSTHYAGIFLSCCVSSMRASFYSVDHCLFYQLSLSFIVSHISYAMHNNIFFKIVLGFMNIIIQ